MEAIASHFASYYYRYLEKLKDDFFRYAPAIAKAEG
jgi:hypothetical protein